MKILFLILTLILLFSCKENSVDTNTPEIKVTQITNLTVGGVYDAKLTPAKSREMYSISENFGMNYEIRICDIDGSNDKQLVKKGDIQFFAISQDETKFAFLNSDDGAIEALYLLDIPSNQLTKLAEEEASVDTSYLPVAFSSDNSKILTEANYYMSSVCIFNINTRTVNFLTENVSCSPVSFMPGENEILYTRLDQIHLINIDGTNDRTIIQMAMP